MNKETENEKIASTIVKAMEKEQNERNELMVSRIAQQLGARIENLIGIAKLGDQMEKFEQLRLSRFQFVENAKLAFLFTTVSVFITSLFAAVTFLIMAVDRNSSLHWLSWWAFAVSCALIIVAPIIGWKLRPESVKYGLKRLEDKVQKLYQADKGASAFDGLIREAEFAISVVENTIKREQKTNPPNNDRIAALKEELSDLNKRKAAYERSKREFGI